MLKATIPLALRNHISFISFIILVKHLSDLNTQIKMPGVECKEYKASCRVLPIEYQQLKPWSSLFVLLKVAPENNMRLNSMISILKGAANFVIWGYRRDNWAHSIQLGRQ